MAKLFAHVFSSTATATDINRPRMVRDIPQTFCLQQRSIPLHERPKYVEPEKNVLNDGPYWCF